MHKIAIIDLFSLILFNLIAYTYQWPVESETQRREEFGHMPKLDAQTQRPTSEMACIIP